MVAELLSDGDNNDDDDKRESILEDEERVELKTCR